MLHVDQCDQLRAVIEGRARWAVIHAEAADVAGFCRGDIASVIADPPYNDDTHKNARTRKQSFHAVDMGIDFEALSSADVVGITRMCLETAKRWTVLFCAMEQLGEYAGAAKAMTRKGELWVRSGLWLKTNGAPQFTGDRPAQSGDGIAIMHARTKKQMRWNGGGSRGAWRVEPEEAGALIIEANVVKDAIYAAEKPVALMMQLVEAFTDRDELVADFWCGSGTTGEACHRLGRRFIGCDISPVAFDLATKRMKSCDDGADFRAVLQGQQSLFGLMGESK